MVSYVRTTQAKLNTVPLVDEQVISVIDTTNENNKIYMDFYDETSGAVVRHNMTPSSSSGSKHTIINPSGTSMANRSGLQFVGGSVEDDANNDRTIVYLWNAYCVITTTSESLYGQAITVTKNGATVGTTQFNNSGMATFAVHEPGTYTFSCTI